MSANGEPLLYTEDLVAGYVPEVNILNGVSIAVREGEIVTGEPGRQDPAHALARVLEQQRPGIAREARLDQ